MVLYDRASMMEHKRFCFLAWVIAAAGLHLPAQVTTGTLYTIATDPSGAVIQGAVVTLRNDASGAVRQLSCDDVGECSFTFLPPGSYTASINAPGFKTLEVSGLQVDSAQNIRRKFALS